MRNDKWSDQESRKGKGLGILGSCICQKFTHTTCLEKLFLLVGILSAVAAGVCMPLIVLLFADLVNVFIQYQLKGLPPVHTRTDRASFFQTKWVSHIRSPFTNREKLNYDGDNLSLIVEKYALETCMLGAAAFGFTYLYTYLLNYVARNQIKRLKVVYLSAILHQVTDSKTSYSETYTRFKRNLHHFWSSVGDNLGSMVTSGTVFFTSLAIAFHNHVILAAMLCVIFPIMAVIMLFSLTAYRYLAETERNHYQISENLAQDVFLNIQTVKAFEGESTEIRRYEKLLMTSQSAGTNTMLLFGVIVGLLYILLYSSYALTFWQGMSMALESKDKGETPDILITVNFCIQICFVNFLKIPIFFYVNKNASKAFEEMTLLIRESREEDRDLRALECHIINEISYNSVSFDYSEKPEGKLLLSNVNIRILPYTMTAMVGASKSGKTTLLEFLVKLKTVDEGSVRIGKWDVNRLSGTWLRSRIGFVQQKTVLFGDTIRDAVKGYHADWSEHEVVAVCRTVNVHSYIMSLKHRYDTFLTSDLPQEVKEKLAIARVLMNNPDVLILDDCMTNMNVFTQMAIITEFLAQSNKTVITVTSKPDIMKTSDLVIYLKDGNIESGTYSQLMTENADFRSDVGKFDQETSVINFETGMVSVSTCKRTKRRNCIGLDLDEIETNDIIISRLPNLKSSASSVTDREMWKDKTVNCWKVLKLNRREFPYLTTAAIAATIMGFSIPAYATLFGESLGTMVLHTKEEIEDNINFFPQMFLLAGVISGVAKAVEGYMIAISCSKLTARLRKKTFEALVYKDMTYFDQEENHMNQLLQLLRKDAKIVPLASGPELVIFIKVVSVIIISSMFAIYHSWKLGLVALAFSPFLLFSLYYMSRFQTSGVYGKTHNPANLFAKEVLKQRDTIQALNFIDHYMEYYDHELNKARISCFDGLRVKSLLFGYSQSVAFFAYAGCMFYGGFLLQSERVSFTNVFKVVESLILGTILLGEVLMVIPDRLPCLRSCDRLLELLPSQSDNAHQRRTCEKASWNGAVEVTNGHLEMKHIGFIHPYIGRIPRLHDVNLYISDRQMIIGLTGLLTSGNSIPVKLLLRFYNPSAGHILLDDLDIHQDYNLKSLRRFIAVVDGKERFFRRTVTRNIAYGARSYRDGFEPYVGMDDIIAAAKEADIHNFVITLPEGYYTIMTEEICKKMTPGQILRLSLARALLRDPRLLVIENIGFEVDEDAQVLMETAILKSSCGRAVVLSSNYLLSISTVADCIYFFQDGYVREFGSHQRLIDKKGLYCKLFERQERELKKLRKNSYDSYDEGRC